VVALDNLTSGNPGNLPREACLEVADLGSDRASALIRSFKPEAIFHFAAQINVRVSNARPVFDAEQNILNTLKLIECGQENGLGFFAFASSGGAIYGEPQDGPQDETHPERPLNPYGVAKLSVDKYLMAFHHLHGLASCSMRFSNIYGPRQNARGEAGVVSIFLTQALAGEPLKINGPGNQTRDFLNVEDLALAMPLILQRKPQGVLNFGTGFETSILQLADLVRAQTPGLPEHIHLPAISGEQMRSVLNPGRARLILGWRSSKDLPSGLLSTAQWFAQSEHSPVNC
jgi:UDP-glucose 4-epimerase